MYCTAKTRTTDSFAEYKHLQVTSGGYHSLQNNLILNLDMKTDPVSAGADATVTVRLLLTYTQCCGSGSVLDPYSGASWNRIRIQNTDPDPHMQI